MFKHGVAFLALAAGLGLGWMAVAQPQSAADAAQDKATMEALMAMQTCMVAKAKAADDGVTDPHKLATGLKDACRAEQDRFATAAREFATHHPGFEAPPPTLSDADRVGAFEAAIIQLRKEAHPG